MMIWVKKESDFSILRKNLSLYVLRKIKVLKQFKIIFTKTDYDRFQLKKYILSENQYDVNAQSIGNFVTDVKLRKLDPIYKS